MSIELITVLMFGGLLILLILGMPVAIATGALAVVFITFLWSPAALVVVAVRAFGQMYQYLLFAIPLFIFLASILQQAGIVEDMFTTFREWTGPLGGGLAIASVLVGTLLAAVVGVIGAAVVTMGIISLPVMLKRKYSKGIALGSIMAGELWESSFLPAYCSSFMPWWLGNRAENCLLVVSCLVWSFPLFFVLI